MHTAPTIAAQPHADVVGTTPTDLPDAGTVVCHTLLNCLVREVCGPDGQTRLHGDRLLLLLPHSGVRLRVRLRRRAVIGAHRFDGPVEVLGDGSWSAVAWQRLAQLVAAELFLRTGHDNDEFLEQVASSHTTIATTLDVLHDTGRPELDDSALGRYLRSEQSLVFGHRFHPTPKARTGCPDQWGRHAPETGARFPLHHLAVREHLVAQETAWADAADPLDLAPAPQGYRLLPAHPWQLDLLAGHAPLQAALARGDVLDLGPGDRPFAATASVRTLYAPDAFLKFSLDVRITNCVRKNAAYELSGAVALTRLLAPVLAGLEERHPGCSVLREPAYRSLALPAADGGTDRTLLEGLGVIVRDGLLDRCAGTTPLLAAAVADEYRTGPAHVSVLVDGRSTQRVLDWWRRYLDLTVPFVLDAFAEGVVLEPHLQNVVVCVDDDGMPARMLFRDLEGTKLVDDRHADTLATLPADVAAPMTYDVRRGWDRVVYCLVVNHLSEVLAALADVRPDLEQTLWSTVHEVLERWAGTHGRPPLLAATLAGVPLPAKSNLMTRWERRPDRAAGYVPLPSPLARPSLDAQAPEPALAGAR